MLVLLGFSWPLWGDSREFPRVPFIAQPPGLLASASWTTFGLLVVAIATATLGVAGGGYSGWAWSR